MGKPFDSRRKLGDGNFNYILGQHIDRYKIFGSDSFDAWWSLVADVHDHAGELTNKALEYERTLSQTRYEGWKKEYDKRKALDDKMLYLECNVRGLKADNEYWKRAASTASYTNRDNIRIQDLEKENAALEGENRDLGTRILDLTKKLTAANDRATTLQSANVRLVREKSAAGGYRNPQWFYLNY